MTIYGRFGNPVEIVRWAIIDDVKALDGRNPDKTDRHAIENGSYLVVRDVESGKEELYHQCYLRADGAAREIAEVRDALPRPVTKDEFATLPVGTVLEVKSYSDATKWHLYKVVGRSSGRTRLHLTIVSGGNAGLALSVSDVVKRCRHPAQPKTTEAP